MTHTTAQFFPWGAVRGPVSRQKAGATIRAGRQSFHPIPCGSRDRPVGRKVIALMMKAKLCVDTALAKSSSCVFPSTGMTAL